MDVQHYNHAFTSETIHFDLKQKKMLELKHNDYNIYMFVCVLLDVYLK